MTTIVFTTNTGTPGPDLLGIRAHYESSSDIFTIDNSIIGAEGDDILAGIRMPIAPQAFADPITFAITLDGGPGDDSLTGFNAIDTLIGGADNDTLGGEPGSFMSGGTGIDTLSLSFAATSTPFAGNLNINYAAQAGATVVLADGSRISGFEKFLIITGTGHDTLDLSGDANALDSNFFGHEGNDTLRVNAATQGFIAFTGDLGTDRVLADLSASATAVTFEGGSGGGGSLSTAGLNVASNDVEFFEIIGGSADDTLLGNGFGDTFSGRGGDDTIDGGLGGDTAVFSGNRASYRVTQTGDGALRVEDLRNSSPDGADSVVDVETFQFADRVMSFAQLANGSRSDFNGDGKSDVLFSNQGPVFKSNYEWQINNRSLVAEGAIDLYDPAFTVQLIGDFDGDGKADALFFNPDTGGAYGWLLDGTTIKSQGAVDVGDPSFNLLGTGDFNGDGKDDVLFRNDAGFIYQWQMMGLNNTPLPVGPLDPVWHVQGTGDFNGDGRDDILLRNISNVANENGAFYLWQMNGNVVEAQGGIERPPVEWKTLGIGDFDGDGKDDFAVRNVSITGDNGAVWVYLMDGTAIKSQGPVGIADAATWHLQQIGDLDGDGKDDILYRNDAGFFYSWNMNGTTIASEGLLQDAAQWADPSFIVVKEFWELV